MVLTEILAFVTQFLVLLTVVLSILQNRKTSRKIDGVHSLVNEQLDTQIARSDQLTATLTDAGVEVPPRPPPHGDSVIP
jgi:hypothetical protein